MQKRQEGRRIEVSNRSCVANTPGTCGQLNGLEQRRPGLFAIEVYDVLVIGVRSEPRVVDRQRLILYGTANTVW